MKLATTLGILLAFVFVVHHNAAGAVLLDFEDLVDSDVVGATYAASGVTFDGALVITAGISLNDADFPPFSGSNAIIGLTDPISLFFSSPVTAFSGRFTYSLPLVLTGFDAANNVVAIANSLNSANYVSSGNAPNELLAIGFPGGIDHLTIASAGAVGDDFAFSADIVVGPVPEPGTLVLGVIAALALILASGRGTFAARAVASGSTCNS